MAKTKISEFSSTPANNTDIDSINIAEGCAPSNINDAIRELMAQLKDFQIGSQGDSFNGPIGTTTAAAGAFTTLSASSTVTLSGGTANGVTYLNGSKVLTSGSALQFDGTNLGLGVTPNAWSVIGSGLQLKGGGSVVGRTDTVTQTHYALNSYFDGTNWKYLESTYATRYMQYVGGHSWHIAPSGTAGNAITFTQAMTLDASGNLLVGATSNGNGYKIYAKNNNTNVTSLTLENNNGGYQVYTSNQELAFFQLNVGERARITSGGSFVIGANATSAANEFLRVYGSNANWIGSFENTNTNPYGNLIQYSSTKNGTGNEFLGCYEGGGASTRLSIRSNGGIANYQANDVNLSDRREKTNFAPAGEYLSKICAIPVQTFNYIDQNLEEDAGLTLGVVAQDVQAVAPELVMESNWAKEGEEPKMRLSIYQTDLQYALMKALQELKAEFDAYKASHP